MITNGPYSLTLGTTLTVPNPLARSGNPPVKLQVQNSSTFVLTVNADGVQLTLQPFIAQTIALAGDGNNVTVTPTQNPYGSSVSNTATFVWLLNGESPPMQDGPLTSAAILASVEGTISVEQNQQLIGTFTLTATASQSQTFTIPANTAAVLLQASSTNSTPGAEVTVFDGGEGTGAPAVFQESPWGNFGIVGGPNNTQSWVFPVSSSGDSGELFVTCVQGGTPSAGGFIRLTALTGAVSAFGPPEAVASFASVTNPSQGAYLLAPDGNGRNYEISALHANLGDSSNVSNLYILCNGVPILGVGSTTAQTASFVPPLVVSEATIHYDTTGSPAGSFFASAAYRYH